MDTVSTSDYYIAFLDLLAVKKIIRQDPDNKALNDVRNIYNSWLRTSSTFDYNILEIKIFSDNILIAAKTSIKNSLESLIEFSASIAEHFLQCGYLIRGAITKGSLYIDDILVWGNGLISAYELESKCAMFPRIIFSKNVLSDVSSRTKQVLLKQDTDDFFYLNYLNNWGKNSTGYLETIDKGLKMAVSEIECNTNPDILQKLLWFKNYLVESKKYHEAKIEDK